MDRAERSASTRCPVVAILALRRPRTRCLAKLEWYRLGDEVSERQWRDVIGVMKVNRASLDRQYLERWAGELGVADLLAKAWKEAESLLS